MNFAGTINFCWNVLEWITKIFYKAVHFCWNQKLAPKLVGTFQQNDIPLFFNNINTQNPPLLERWNCGTKNTPHHNQYFFSSSSYLLERKNQPKPCWDIPIQPYSFVFQPHSHYKPDFVGTLELRNEKQPPT
jgi:hypothetical protein